jgi:hypothetical protein
MNIHNRMRSLNDDELPRLTIQMINEGYKP